MSLARRVSIAAISLIAVVSVSNAAGIKKETVAGGVLQQTWQPAFGVGRSFTALTLTGTDPANPNPSGDNTVAVLQNNAINLGGIAACATDPGGYADYIGRATSSPETATHGVASSCAPIPRMASRRSTSS